MATPRDYQSSAVDAAWGAYQDGVGRAHVVMATGLGKSWTAWWFMQLWLRDNPGKRALCLVDRKDPTAQNRRSFHEICGQEFTTGIRYTGKSVKLNARVLFTTFQSVGWLIENGRLDPTDVGLVVVDESHHAPADTYVSELNRFTDAFFFGMTATNERMDGLDPDEIFGPPVFTYTLAAALKHDKWLARVEYNLLTDNISMMELRRLVEEVLEHGSRQVSRSDINDTLFLESAIQQVRDKVEEQWARGFRKTIIFCRGINHVREVVERFPEAEAYHSKQKHRQGEETPLDRFRKGSTQVLAVVDKLNEAIDVPEADLMVFWRSTVSRRIWLQQLGRGLRKTGSKTTVVVLDFVASVERLLWLQNLETSVREATGRFGGTSSRDALVISEGSFGVEYAEELLDLLRVLEQLNTEFYSTWARASAATQALNISDLRGYNRRYNEDPRLPSSPHHVYEDVWKQNGGWPGFLGTLPYATWEEASAATQALGIRTGPDYLECYKQDRRLPSEPYEVYSGVWKQNGGWPGFLGSLTYSTWEEASVAARVLGARTGEEYRTRYKGDPRLPSNPSKTYSDVWLQQGGLHGFLGTSTYGTWEEASAAAQELGVLIKEAYQSRYSENPRLPSNPESVYESVWRQNGGWRGFLGTYTYGTWEEASAAARALGVRSGTEYKARYKEDSRLVSAPDNKYEGVWKQNRGWTGFLGTYIYGTWEEASAAAQALGVRTRREYESMYRQDPHLPSNPSDTYSDVWVRNGGLRGYLGTQKK